MVDSQSAREEVPVLAGVATPEQAKRARTWRRLGITVLALVVVGACVGWLGPRNATATDTSGRGMGLTVDYPQLTRPGLDSAVTITLDPRDTSTTELVVELDPVMFDRLGVETITPAPTEESAGPDAVRLSFEWPPAGSLTVTLAGRVPTRAVPGTFAYAVRTSDGATRAHVQLRTWVLP